MPHGSEFSDGRHAWDHLLETVRLPTAPPLPTRPPSIHHLHHHFLPPLSPVICSLPVHLGSPSLSDIFESHITFHTLGRKRSNLRSRCFSCWSECQNPACQRLLGWTLATDWWKCEGGTWENLYSFAGPRTLSSDLVQAGASFCLFVCFFNIWLGLHPPRAELISDRELRVYLYCCSEGNETRVGLTATHHFSQQSHFYCMHCCMPALFLWRNVVFLTGQRSLNAAVKVKNK